MTQSRMPSGKPSCQLVNNVHVGDNDLIGSRFNGHDLHRYLRQRGIEASHLVKVKQSDDPHTHLLDEGYLKRPAYDTAVNLLERRYNSHALHGPLGMALLDNPLFLNADIVHYHLIHNASFNISLLPTLTALKPSVWTIHDAWAFTGHCIQPLDCERWKIGCGECPYLDTPFVLSRDTSALHWEIKRDILQRCQLDLIVASQHMLDRVQQSPILADLTTHLVPFGIDLQRFSPASSADARARLGVRPDHLVLCFRADPSPFKGLPFIKEALERLSATVPITLLTVGRHGELAAFRSRYQIIDAGWLTNDDAMLDVYRAADIFLMPSMGEAFGMMAMEAMACGKPVIAFEGTSLPEVLAAPQGGIVVPRGDVAALTAAVERLITSPETRQRLGEQARQVAEERYHKDTYVSRIIAVYEEVIAKRQPTARTTYILGEQRKTVAPKSELPRLGTRRGSRPAAATTPRSFKASPHYAFYIRARQRRGMRLVAVLAVRPLAYLGWLASKLRGQRPPRGLPAAPAASDATAAQDAAAASAAPDRSRTSTS